MIRSSAVGALGLALLLLGPLGCDSNRGDCEAICRTFINTCEWTAWSHVSQCTQGCVEDMYRRDDVAEIFACYRAATAEPSRQDAEATVQRALDAGLFAKAQELGSFDLQVAIDAAIQHGTCDAFAVVQCKVQALKAPPSGLFIQP